jgi:hypothetical protein
MKKVLSLLIGLIFTINAFAIGEDRNVQTTIENFIPVTTTQMNALVDPQQGDIVWNSTDGTLVFYNGVSWVNVASGLISLTSGVSGILPRANGGTGLSASGSLGNVLTSDGTNWISSPLPSFGTGDVSGPASSVDSQFALFDATTGKLIKAATGTGVVKSTSGVYSVSNINLTSEVTGILPFANGGTGLSTVGTARQVLTSDGTNWISDFVDYADVLNVPTDVSTFNNDAGYLTGPAGAVDGEIALFDGASGEVVRRATQTGVAKLLSGVLSASNVNLTSEVSGILPRANGGTGLSASGSLGNVLTSDGTNWISSPLPSGLGDVYGPASSVDSQIALFDSTTGKIIKAATLTGVAKVTSGVLSVSNVSLTSEVSGILPIANGGTNSSTALSGSSIMISNGASVIQGAAGTTSTVLHGNASGAPTYSAVSLTGDVSGILPRANGGTGLSASGGLGNVLTSNGTDWISSPLPSFLESLNGLAATQQYFANGSSGTAPAFVSAIDTHTLNIPLASGSGVTSGTISKANFDSFSGKVDGPSSSVDSQVALFDSTTGKLIKTSTATGVAKLSSGVLSASNVSLTSEVSGTLPVANGGTGLTSPSTANKVLTSDGAGNWTSDFVAYANVTGTPTNVSFFTNDAGYITTIIPSIFGSRTTPRNVQAAGITTAASHMSASSSSQDIYVCGSNNGTTCNASITLATINQGTIDGQRMCIIGRDATRTVTLNAASTTNIEINGNAVIRTGRTICLRYDGVNWGEVSRNF